jgi:hypothetical protein
VAVHTSMGLVAVTQREGLLDGVCATGALTAQAVLDDIGLPTAHIMTALRAPLLSPHGLQYASQHCGAVHHRFIQQPAAQGS